MNFDVICWVETRAVLVTYALSTYWMTKKSLNVIISIITVGRNNCQNLATLMKLHCPNSDGVVFEVLSIGQYHSIWQIADRSFQCLFRSSLHYSLKCIK